MFVCTAIRAVGKVVELARIVYDRHGTRFGNAVQKRQDANRIALDCLYGLYTLTEATDHMDVVGECAMVMQRIMVQLMSDGNISAVRIEDPNGVLGLALRRIILLLLRSLSSRIVPTETEVDTDVVVEKETTELDRIAPPLGSVATASLIWMFGEFIAPVHSSLPGLVVAAVTDNHKSKMKLELIRLVAQTFVELDECEKEQAIHLASKLYLSNSILPESANADMKLEHCCELVLSMGRLDVNPVVRDRARYESLLLDSTMGLKYDREGLEALSSPALGNTGRFLTLDDLSCMLLAPKPSPSHLPLDVEDAGITTDGETTTHFRFGTLSSLVGHKAGSAYLPLPPWADKNSPASLRDGSTRNNTSTTEPHGNNWKVDPNKKTAEFYESSGEDEDSEEESDDDEEEDSDESEEEEDSEDDDDEVDDDTGDDDHGENQLNSKVAQVLPVRNSAVIHHTATNGETYLPTITNPTSTAQKKMVSESEDDDESEDEDSSDDDSSDEDIGRPANKTVKEANLLGLLGATTATPNVSTGTTNANQSLTKTNASAITDDLSGLVMAPLDVRVPNIENDSGAWLQLIRPSVSGGLDVKARFLRGPSKEQEARRKGLDPDFVGTVCMQIRMENIKSDSTILRRIRLVQRSMSNISSSSSSSSSSLSTTATAIFPRQAMLPGEVASLSPGQVVLEIIGLEFATVPDRDGSCMIKLEVKHGTTGGIPAELKIPLAELLRCNGPTTQQLLSVNRDNHHMQQFDSAMQRMQGFQRVSTSIPWDSSSSSLTDHEASDNHKYLQQQQILLKTILDRSALIPLPVVGVDTAVPLQLLQQQNEDKKYWKDHQLRLVANLPTSGDVVLVLVTTTSTVSVSNPHQPVTATTSTTTPLDGGSTSSIQLTVCCDNALAVNHLVDTLKRAIHQSIHGQQ